MKASIFLLFLITIIGGCTQRQKENDNEQKELTIKFLIDDTVQRIGNTYRISMVNERDTSFVKTRDDSIYLPRIENSKKYDVLFSFGKYKLSFKGLSGSDIVPKQKMLWEIGIDNKPFNYLEGFLSREEYERNSYHKVEYLRFNPQEHGDGIQIVNKY